MMRDYLDLRFKNREDELAFVASREEHSLRLLALVAAVAFLIYPWQMCAVLLPEMRREASPFLFSWQDPRMLYFMVLTQYAAACCLILVLVLMRLRTNWLRRIPSEGFWLIVAIYWVMSLCMLRTWNSVGLGSGGGVAALDRVWVHDPCGYELAVVLKLDVVVTLLCTCGPMRVHYLAIPALWSPAFYLYVCLTFGAPDPAGLPSLCVIMVVLSCLGLLGAWKQEGRRRAEWLEERARSIQQAELDAALGLAGGMQAIARRLCDFTFKLGPDLCVCEHDRAHEAFVGRPLFGEHFLSLVSSEDQRRFQALIARAAQSRVPHCIHLTLLRDAGRVQAQVLASGPGPRQESYVVGVRLDGSEPHSGQDAALPLRCPPPPQLLGPAPPPRAESVVASTTSSGPLFNDPSLDRLAERGRLEHWWLDASDLQMNLPPRVLGCGSFGVVVVARFHGKAVAVKMPKGCKDGHRLRELANELRVLRFVRHPNIVLFHGALVDPMLGELALVYELVRGMTLGDYISEPPAAPCAFNRYCLTLDVCCALRYLHAQLPCIVHGDLKDGNVMVEPLEARARAKLIDFGLARFLTPHARRLGGTKGWRAPETLTSEFTVPASGSDVFSFGWLVYFIMSGLRPHGGRVSDSLQDSMKDMMRRRHVEPLELKAGVPFCEATRALCEACLRYEKEQRPDMQAVYNTLLGWLDVTAACQLGFDVATALLPEVSWRDGARLLHTNGTGSGAVDRPLCGDMLEMPSVQVDIMAMEELDILLVTPFDLEGPWPCMEGASFCDWLEDPGPVRVWIGATASDVRQGWTPTPAVLDFGRVALRLPEAVVADEALGMSADMKIYFPDASGRASIRLLLWRREARRPRDVAAAREGWRREEVDEEEDAKEEAAGRHRGGGGGQEAFRGGDLALRM